MLKKYAFANALAAVSALSYVVMYVLSLVAPVAYKVVFNAQFLGANIAPSHPDFDIASLISVAVLGWVVGYVFVWIYNRWA
jgi:uncharacterized membrane protein (DUF485 family)